MEKSERKTFTTADEVREFPQGRVELLNAGGVRVGRVTFEPGWRWTTSIGPLADTPTCDVRHFFYHLSGTLGVRMDDGTQFECRPGELAILPPGHDRGSSATSPSLCWNWRASVIRPGLVTDVAIFPDRRPPPLPRFHPMCRLVVEPCRWTAGLGNPTWTGRWVRRLLGQLLRRVPRVRLFLRSREGSSYPGPRTSTSRSVRPAGCTRRGGAWPSYGPSRPGGGPAHAGAPGRPHAATGDARARSRSAPDRAHIALPGMYRAGHPAAAHLPPAWTPRSSATRASEVLRADDR